MLNCNCTLDWLNNLNGFTNMICKLSHSFYQFFFHLYPAFSPGCSHNSHAPGWCSIRILIQNANSSIRQLTTNWVGEAILFLQFLLANLFVHAYGPAACLYLHFLTKVSISSFNTHKKIANESCYVILIQVLKHNNLQAADLHTDTNYTVARCKSVLTCYNKF